MIRTRNTARRGGFTLVELLVGISIFLTLTGLVLLLYPGARDQDRVKYTVSDITAHVRMAQSMAARDKAPRGVRFVVNTTDPNPDKTDPRWVTELQFIEQPAALIPNRNPLTTADPNLEPRVRFEYTFVPPVAVGQPAPNPPPGTVTARRCLIENLPRDQADLIVAGCTLDMPVFRWWSKINRIVSLTEPTAGSNRWTVSAELDVFPDALMGGSTHNLTYHFAVYLRATPLIGEPVVPLSKNICVDLNISVPRVTGNADLDVLFGPDGKLVNSSSGQIFLWVRDFTKPAVYSGTGGAAAFLTGAPLMDALRRGGEQDIVVIRSSGATAYNNVAWPANSTNYTSSAEPYQLARDQGR